MENLNKETEKILNEIETELKENEKITDKILREIEEEAEALKFFNLL